MRHSQNIFGKNILNMPSSLRAFIERNPCLHGVRMSMSPYREQDWITNYPLYSVLAEFGQEHIITTPQSRSQTASPPLGETGEG